MKLIFLVLTTLLMASCGDAPPPSKEDSKVYDSIYLKVEKITTTNGNIPTYPILVSTLSTPKRFCLFEDAITNEMMSKNWLFNLDVGDSLFFIQIRKDRFFEIEDDTIITEQQPQAIYYENANPHSSKN